MRRHLFVLLPLFLVACEPEKNKPDQTAALQRKLSELEDLVSNQRQHTLQVLQEHEQRLDEHEGKIRQILQEESAMEDKFKSLASDLGSSGGNSRELKKKISDLEMEISDMNMEISKLKMGVSNAEMELSRLQMGMRSLR